MASGSGDAVREHNRRAWDNLARQKQRFTLAAPDDDLSQPFSRIDGADWFGDVRGKRLLCLGSGGGRQSALYAVAGAEVTVVDLSPLMLAQDRAVAGERKLNIRCVETSIDDLSMFKVNEFDIVSQPVSTCYVPDVIAVYRQVARVLNSGGLYISQHKQPTSLQADVSPSARGYQLVEPYYRSGPLPPVSGSPHREEGTLEFLHRWEELLGGLCRSGFVIEDLTEPNHAHAHANPGEFSHRSQYVAPYVRIKARRIGGNAGKSDVWLPG